MVPPAVPNEIVTLMLIFYGGIIYLLGAVPFGYLIGRMKGIDVRQVGTGNIGASNVGWTVGIRAGFLVMFLDILKGWLAVRFTQGITFDSWLIVASALLVIIGHDFSIFLGVGGGNGLATLGGVLLAWDVRLVLISIILWFLVALWVRYMALSTIIAQACLPFLLWIFFKQEAYVVFGLVNIIISLICHRDNLRRIIKGEEPTLSLLGEVFLKKRRGVA